MPLNGALSVRCTNLKMADTTNIKYTKIDADNMNDVLGQLEKSGLMPYSLGLGPDGPQLLFAPKEQIDAGCEKILQATYSAFIDEDIMSDIKLYRGAETSKASTAGAAGATGMTDTPDVDHIKPKRLVLINASKCDFCKKTYNCDSPTEDSKTSLRMIEYLKGWVVCDDCVESHFRQNYIAYLNSECAIPLEFLYDSKWCVNRNLTFKFWRSSKKAVYLSCTEYAESRVTVIPNDRTDISVYTAFYDKPWESSDGAKISKGDYDRHIRDGSDKLVRCVSLQNLFHHNPGLYEAIISADNLCGKNSDIKIKLDDLSPAIRENLRCAYERSKVNGPAFEF